MLCWRRLAVTSIQGRALEGEENTVGIVILADVIDGGQD